MAAHWVVIGAAALTTLVAAAVGAALAAFAGQALPQAVRHDLVNAPGNSIAASGPFNNGDPRSTAAAFKSAIGTALPAVPFGFWSATWSNPLGLVPSGLPARPSGAGPGTTPLLEAAALDGITSHAVLVSGSWPAPSAGPSGTIPAALPAASAALLRLHVGDVLRLADRDTAARLTFTITGLYARRQLPGPAASYWQLDTLPASGSSRASGFITYGPLVVPPTAFPRRLAAATGSWVAQPNLAHVSGTELSAMSASVLALEQSLNTSNALSGLQLSSNLPTLFADIGANLALARSLLAISGLELLVLAVAALIAVARLLATQREGETALLIARGATRWQLTRLTAAEAVPVSVAAALIGGAAGVWLARWLGGSLYGQATVGGTAAGGGISLTAAGSWTDALAATVLIMVLASGSLLYPVLRPAAVSARVRRGRGAALAAGTRAGADLALIALAVLAGWQLRRYSAVATSATGGAPAIDPVLAFAPALALTGGTVLTLRLLPAAARAADRLAAGGRLLTAAMAGWQFSRQPLRQGGAALLIVMAVATGTLALAQHQSWNNSTADQAAQAVGADVRVDLAVPLPPAATARLTHAAGVSRAMAVAVDQATLPATITAIESAQAADVVRLRDDQSPLPPSQLFAAITPAGKLVPPVIPVIATSAFDEANHTSPGETVTGTVEGITFPARIVAQVGSFPTVGGSSLIMDLTTLQSLLASRGGLPLAVTQWWLATAGHGLPPALTAALPAGADVTSRTAVRAATANDPLSAAPQQALLAVTAAAALLAITGFLVSIAANVRQRRAENALLAALGVSQRSAAAQLFLEKLLLSLPAAALGLVLGLIVARLLVPAVTLTTTAQLPVPPAVTLLDLPQTVPLAVAVAVLPALAAALVVFRRPDPAAELRAAEAA